MAAYEHVLRKRTLKMVGVVVSTPSPAEQLTREHSEALCAKHGIDSDGLVWDSDKGVMHVPLPASMAGAVSVNMLRLALLQTDPHASIRYEADPLDPHTEQPVLVIPSQEMRTSHARMLVALACLVLGVLGLALAWYGSGTGVVLESCRHAWSLARASGAWVARLYGAFMDYAMARE